MIAAVETMGLPRGSAAWPIRTVGLATDLSPASDVAASRAIGLARRLDSRLLVINVLDRGRLSGLGTHARVDQARAEREEALVALVQRARDEGVHAEFVIWPGDAGTGIVTVAEAEAVELLVVGTRGREGAGRMLLGSVSDHVVRHAPCPVLVVRQTGEH